MSIPAHVQAAYVMAHTRRFWVQGSVYIWLLTLRAKVLYQSGEAVNEVEKAATTLANLHQVRIAAPSRPQLVR